MIKRVISLLRGAGATVIEATLRYPDFVAARSDGCASAAGRRESRGHREMRAERSDNMRCRDRGFQTEDAVDPGLGDLAYTEISRREECPGARRAALKNDNESALLLGMIGSWMAGNPPFRGPSWISGIEVSLRVISVAVALSIIGVDRLDTLTRRAALRFFFAHVDWIRRFPSLHSSANNHRIAELAGLIVGSIMAPGFPDSFVLRENSWRALFAEIDQQIHPDGVRAEQSAGYTAFSIELFLVAAAALAREGSLPATTVDRLSAWSEHSLWLMDTAAKVPAIGDFDDCRAIATTQGPEPKYVASVVAAVSGCVSRPDLAPPARDQGIRDVILGSAKTSPAQCVGLRSFTRGGYSVFRSRHKHPVVLTFDHGPIGYLSIAAHGHADTLSVWLSVGGQPVIVDAGTTSIIRIGAFEICSEIPRSIIP
jgi:hypothetical protein